jgi:tetratricopeptide (TPR) repeat protein
VTARRDAVAQNSNKLLTRIMHSRRTQSIRIVGWRKYAIRATLVILAPLLVCALLEGTLWLFSYGHPVTFFVQLEDTARLGVNDKFGWRFAPAAIAPKPRALTLLDPKPADTIRIFVLGESAAQGTPDPSYGFSRILQVMLRRAYPAEKFEVCNVAVTAINSHVIREIAQQCADHQPDLFLVYMGNNEFVGPYGPSTAFHGYLPSLSAIRASLWVRSFKTGQFIESMIGDSSSDNRPRNWEGMATFSENEIPPDDPRRGIVHQHFRQNLEDILDAGIEAGAEVIVSTVGSNLKDCPPFRSMNGATLSDEDRTRWVACFQDGKAQQESWQYDQAITSYRKAVEIDDRQAELQFRLASCYLAVEESEKAARHFKLARDYDALQFRTDSMLNETIRAVAAHRNSEEVICLDFERLLEQPAYSPGGIPGDELFWEHVHLRFDGNYLLAKSFFSAIANCLALGPPQSELPSTEQCADDLALTLYDRRRMADSMLQMTSREPFIDQLDHGQRVQANRSLAESLVLDAAAMAGATDTYQAAIDRSPDDWELRFNFANFLLAAGDVDGAAEHMNIVMHSLPGDLGVRSAMAFIRMKAGHVDEAIDVFEELIAESPNDATLHKRLGDAWMFKKRPERAIEHFQAALQLNESLLHARINLGVARLSQGDLTSAQVEFERALETQPDASAHYNMAAIMVRQGKIDHAIEHYQETCRLEPTNVAARNNLAAILLERGNVNDAIQHLRAAIAAQPDYANAHATLGQALVSRSHNAVAIEHLQKAIELGDESPAVLSTLAFLLATNPDEGIRDGQKALQLAEQACRQTNNRAPSALDAMAAAYAEMGDFPKAIAVAEEAHRMALAAGLNRQADLIGRRLQYYRSGQPFRS